MPGGTTLSGDVNGDRKPDLVNIDGAGSFTVSLALGKGAFHSLTSFSPLV